MKKIVLQSGIFFLTIFLLFTACSSSDDNSNTINPVTNNLIGTWNVTVIIAVHPQLGQASASDIQGTIEFRENGSGKEDYSYTAFGMSFSETDSFNWVSTSANIITDPGTNAELIWDRVANTTTRQIASYTDEDGVNFTLTLEK